MRKKLTKKQKPWDRLTTDERTTLLDNLTDDELAARFDKSTAFFRRVRRFFESVPEQTVPPKARPHSPPKDLVLSARRDLSFAEANFELIDNSIDKWRCEGAKRNLAVEITYDLDLEIGTYTDDAGGMPERDVYKVFIPGETTNRDLTQNVIGSFGMGAKKGIFRLTDGAKIVSCTSDDFSATSEVPEKWEEIPNWETLDGRAQAIGRGRTTIYFLKLFSPPSQADIDDLILHAGRVYRPLLDATLLKRRLAITVNGISVHPSPGITWSAPKGAAPRIYELSHTFRNFLNTGQDIPLTFEFRAGLTQKLPGKSSDIEPDWGIDVYGNGRLFDRFLKEQFGFGTKGLATGTQGNKYFRGELFITGHSFAVPWDTHKREYMRDHPVSRWLRTQLREIVKAYAGIGRKFADQTKLRHKYLAATSPTNGSPFPRFTIAAGQKPAAKTLPKWMYEAEEELKPTKKSLTKTKGAVAGPATGSKAKITAGGTKSYLVSMEFGPAEFDELLERFDASCEEEAAEAIRDCLTNGVVFPLTGRQLQKALKILKCGDNLAQLSQTIRRQLLKTIGM